MKLRGLLKGIEYKVLQGNDDINISNIQYDSRNVTEGNLFVCIVGFKTDGHKYADKAIESGAKALLVENDIEGISEDITIIKVKDTRVSIASIADRYYNHPSDKFKLVGVTGTNGKTSTVFLTKGILDEYGKKTGVIGTIENRIGNKVLKTSRTTPEAIDLQNLFYNMFQENVNDVIMEVSSHALELHRVDKCRFDVGIYTNLTLDHLDFHKTMENYRDAKLKLFKMCKIGIINLDDEYADYMIENATCQKIMTYGLNNEKATLNAINISFSLNGTHFTLVFNNNTYQIKLSTPGKFSVYNALAAIGASLALEVPMEAIIKGLEKNKGIKGRYQSMASKKGYNVIVDYAHAPDGLLNILKSTKEFATSRIITVFGCGGDRDKSKRPIMGKIAGEYSDFCVLTSDNPRTEDPVSILNEIETGIKDTKCPYVNIVDREEGIKYALQMAETGDIIIVAGKGHEDYQILNNKIIHFDDTEVVLNYFQGE